jgi:hypothetical protein
MNSTLKVQDAIINLTTNSDQILVETCRDFGTSEPRSDPDGTISIFKKKLMSLQIPEYSIRISVVPPRLSVYKSSNQIFVEERGRFILRLDRDKNELYGYVQKSVDISHRLRFLIKWMFVKILMDKGIFFLHGSAVDDEHNASIFTGPPGCGKTTTLITLLHEGFRKVADDISLIRDGKIVPFPMRSFIHKDAFERYPNLKKGLDNSSTYSSELDGWWVNLGGIFPTSRKEVPVSRVFYLHVWNSAHTKCKEIPRSQMLSMVSQASLQDVRTSIWIDPNSLMNKAFPVYHSLLEKVDCYNAYVGWDREEFLKSFKRILS